MSFFLEGVGLHTGAPVKLSIQADQFGSGLTFSHEGKTISARPENVQATKRGTSLNGLSTIEHFLAAAAGLNLFDLLVEVSGPELPVLDGSALPFVQALENSGLAHSPRRQPALELKLPIKITDGPASLEALPYHGFKINFVVNFQGIGEQRFTFNTAKQSFKTEIAPARTFGYLEEYEALKAQGLALGASKENTLVLNHNGYVNQPRFADEVVRHKILDLIGDLALIGRPLEAEINAVQSGHRLNVELARRLLEHA